jgi:hypothetical protein
MPASSGMRSRPQIGLMRPRSRQRLHISGVLQAMPKGLVLPIFLVAGVTLAAASSWTYGIHMDEAIAAIAAPEVTGTIKTVK